MAKDIIVRWQKKTPISLLALDAPLGWPTSLGETLIDHEAGQQVAVDSDKLFHRETDTRIKLPSGRKPLEVRANLIARTAKSALNLLYDLRNMTGESIPLVWEFSVPQQLSAIEVYPAATPIPYIHFSPTGQTKLQIDYK